MRQTFQSISTWHYRSMFALTAVLLSVLLSGVTANAETARQWLLARRDMVNIDIVGAGIDNNRVIAAMWGTPRHEFIPADQRKYSYFDMALPIGEQQTISPPYIVAYMTERLDPQATDKVLEIGTGSGYQAAVLSHLAKEVYTIEIVESLGKRAQETLTRLNYNNVHSKIGDGYKGWPEHAPFDRIIVTCSPDNVPRPLVDQLREGGRMIVPLGERYQQTLYLMKKEDGKMVTEALEPTFFVPMTGRAEALRADKSEASLSDVVNGGFEQATIKTDQPDGWYYVRQARLDSHGRNAASGQALVFSNTVAGRSSQALQALGVDGSRVAQLELSLWVRASGIHAGVVPEQMPKLLVSFFDENRNPQGQESIGPWQGSFGWTFKTGQVKVPKKARVAIVGTGLLGATGELAVDDLQIAIKKPR